MKRYKKSINWWNLQHRAENDWKTHSIFIPPVVDSKTVGGSFPSVSIQKFKRRKEQFSNGYRFFLEFSPNWWSAFEERNWCIILFKFYINKWLEFREWCIIYHDDFAMKFVRKEMSKLNVEESSIIHLKGDELFWICVCWKVDSLEYLLRSFLN